MVTADHPVGEDVTSLVSSLLSSSPWRRQTRCPRARKQPLEARHRQREDRDVLCEAHLQTFRSAAGTRAHPIVCNWSLMSRDRRSRRGRSSRATRFAGRRRCCACRRSRRASTVVGSAKLCTMRKKSAYGLARINRSFVINMVSNIERRVNIVHRASDGFLSTRSAYAFGLPKWCPPANKSGLLRLPQAPGMPVSPSGRWISCAGPRRGVGAGRISQPVYRREWRSSPGAHVHSWQPPSMRRSRRGEVENLAVVVVIIHD